MAELSPDRVAALMEEMRRRDRAFQQAQKGIYEPVAGDEAYNARLRKKVDEVKQEKGKYDKAEGVHQRNVENIRGGKAMMSKKVNQDSTGPLGGSARFIDRNAAELGVDPQFYLLHGEDASKLEAQRVKEDNDRKARVAALAEQRSKKAAFEGQQGPGADLVVGADPALVEDARNRRKGSEVAKAGGAFAILHPTIDSGEELDVGVTNPFTYQTSRAKDARLGSGNALPGAMSAGSVDDMGKVTYDSDHAETAAFSAKVRAVAEHRKNKLKNDLADEQKRQAEALRLEREHELAIARARAGLP